MFEKLGSRWFIVVLATALGIWAAVENWPLNLGIDLRGGVTITYSVDPEELKKQGADRDSAMDQVVSVISTRVDTMGVKDLSVRKEGGNRIQIQAPKLTSSEIAEIKDRMVQLGKLEFLIGLGELDEKDAKRSVKVHSAQPGNFEQHAFDQDAAEKQRQQAITDGKSLIAAARAAGKTDLPQEAYRDGMPYDFKAADGRKLGIIWKRFAPHITKERLARKGVTVTADDIKKAFINAGEGREYESAHILGAWVYLDPDFDPPFSGNDIDKPQASVDQMQARAVSYRVKTHRQGDFATFTGRHVNHPMCLVLNDEIWSSPIINQALRDSVQIYNPAGGFSKEEQDWLVNCLQSGSLKLRPRPEGEENVGALLGEKAVGLGVLSTILSAVLIFAFALVYYRFSGVIAIITLIMNLGLTIAVLALFGSTLNLPGVAGLVLTLGMAIDANILIFERIREELEKGKTIVASVQAGFDRAFVTIIDSNLTTVITSVLLYKYGVGPIKGFAVSLMAGLMCSLFTACFVGKTLFAQALKSGLVTKLSMMKMLPNNLRIRFLDRAKTMVTASALAIVLSVVAFFAAGESKYGLDFTGGYSIRMNTTEAMSTSDVDRAVEDIRDEQGNPKYPQVQSIGLADTKTGKDTFKAFELKIQSLSVARPETITAKVRQDLQDPALLGEELKEVRTAVRDEETGDWTVEFVTTVEHPLSELSDKIFKHKDARGQESYMGASINIARGTRIDELSGDSFGTEFQLRTNEKGLLGHEVIDDLVRAFPGKLAVAENAKDLTAVFPKLSYVGPNVVSSLKEKAIVAIILSLIANIIYIWFRFKEVKYGVAAVVAVFHDALIALGATVVFHKTGLVDVPIDLPIIAGILTVMGYSLNDTIVIFDRMRENLGNIKGTFKEILDISINQTLDRTILTALTVFISTAVLFVANKGQSSGIEGMAFVLLVGVVVGTYSTVYIATPIVLWMHDRAERKGRSGPKPVPAPPKPAPQGA